MDDQTQPAAIDPIARLLERLNADSVFGAPTEVGDVTVIPVAEINTGFGYGFGLGAGLAPGAGEGRHGERGAAGASGKARPLGYIRVAADGVQFEPMIDPVRIPLAGIALAGWIVFWVTRTIRALRR